MTIPRIYEEQPCPLPGYDGMALRLLVNPPNGVWKDWIVGNLGTPGCTACAELGDGARCSACTEARSRFARGAVALYGPTLLEWPCTTEAEALAAFESDDLPAELLTWLLIAPGTTIEKRQTELLGNLSGSLTTPST